MTVDQKVPPDAASARELPEYSIGELREQVAQMSVEEFHAFLISPVLVSAPPSPDVDDEWSFRTGSYTAVRDEETGTFFDLPDDHEVRCIRKHATMLFKDTILIGRTDACDVVIRDASVSKLHARIHVQELGAHYLISDAGSSNGTHVDNHRLANGESVQLPEAGVLILGSRVFHVLSPRRLWKLLRKLDRVQG